MAAFACELIPDETSDSFETSLCAITSESGELQTEESEPEITAADILKKLRNPDMFSAYFKHGGICV